MNATWVDGLQRTLLQSPSRRGVLRVIAGLAAGPLGAVFRLYDATARKKRKKKKRKKRKPPAACAAECCADADCPAGSGQTCQDGDCRCPPGQGNSGGVCGVIPMCIEPQVPCSEGTCCSATCAPNEQDIEVCQPSESGEPCLRDDYCAIGLLCVGFVCMPV